MTTIALRALFFLLFFLLGSSLAAYQPFDYSNEANPPNGPGNASMTEKVKHPLKYSNFVGSSESRLIDISTAVCRLSLDAYRGNATAREILGPVQDYCWTHGNCILGTISQHVTTSFAGTSILLGLAPTTLSVLGPSVAEMALLSIHRPFLSFLLSLGAPAVFPGRFLLWDDPLKANEAATGAFIVSAFKIKGVVLVSLLQYIVALSALANILHATYKLGIHSIISWDCRSSYWPLLWVLLSVIIHITAVLSLKTAIRRKRVEDLPSPTSVDSGNFIDTRGHGLGVALKNELTPCANSSWRVFDLYDVKLGPLAVTLQYVGALIAVCHLVFGTLLFSSVLFVEVSDAVSLVLRLMASATACRLILQFEVGGMINVDERRIYKWIVQAPLEEKSE